MVTLSEEGYSGRAIARKQKISLCAVQEIIKKARETGSVNDRPRCGRPASTTPRQDRLLSHLSLSDRRATSKILKRELVDATGVDVTTRTVRRRLQKAGLRGCVAARKPLQTPRHKSRRLAWTCVVPGEERLDTRAVGEGSVL